MYTTYQFDAVLPFDGAAGCHSLSEGVAEGAADAMSLVGRRVLLAAGASDRVMRGRFESDLPFSLVYSTSTSQQQQQQQQLSSSSSSASYAAAAVRGGSLLKALAASRAKMGGAEGVSTTTAAATAAAVSVQREVVMRRETLLFRTVCPAAI
jgi:hypothetical protein